MLLSYTLLPFLTTGATSPARSHRPFAAFEVELKELLNPAESKVRENRNGGLDPTCAPRECTGILTRVSSEISSLICATYIAYEYSIAVAVRHFSCNHKQTQCSECGVLFMYNFRKRLRNFPEWNLSLIGIFSGSVYRIWLLRWSHGRRPALRNLLSRIACLRDET